MLPSPAIELTIEQIAELIAADGSLGIGPPDTAREIAEAQAYLCQISIVRRQVEQDIMAALHNSPDPKCPSSLEDVSDLLRNLERLARYERRAFSLRKSTIRRMIRIK
ncbi:hypothetical protein MOX02_61100 [Methylobacterium oxalidis]|uniref:Uncharacterized protein n=1 Tax=Methylobacterium oxalidis TaxID=944322 RepID=A0A512JDN5_9HYPH|nr:hypothetical protein MOX02_61100 [Methylobacterium oxalidis]